MVLVFRDVSERRESERALRVSESRKAAILRASLDAIVTIDGEGKMVEFNPAAQALLSYTAAEAVGQDLDQFFRLDGKPGPFAHSLTAGEAPPFNTRLEYPAVRKDGSRLTVELVVTRLEGSSRPLYSVFLRDVTLQKQAREAIGQLLESEKQRIRAVAARGDGVPHDQLGHQRRERARRDQERGAPHYRGEARRRLV